MQLLNANADAKVTGLDQLPGRSNYFLGNDPAKWVKHAPTYAKVRYEQVYPGIDLVYYGNQRQLEYDFVVAPGADPKNIRMELAAGLSRLEQNGGIKPPLQIEANGELVIKQNGGEVRFHKPLVYQERLSEIGPSDHRAIESLQNENQVSSNGSMTQSLNDSIGFTHHSSLATRHSLEGHYVLTADNRISFAIGDYDKTLPLIIDPVLSYSTYLGGSGDDGGIGIAVDASCNAYISGGTTSLDFPTTATAKQTTFGGRDPFCTGGIDCGDAFVTKLSPDGTAIVYSTYLGGTEKDSAFFIAVDTTGSAYVAGQTKSTNFPTTPGAFQTAFGGGKNAFVTRLSPDGSTLIYSTYLGGNGGGDSASDIAADSSGNAYVAGRAQSSNFPTTSGAFQTTLNCRTLRCANAFVARINTNASGVASLVYSTYLGGSGGDEARGIAIDLAGNAYVTGNTVSTNFPTTSSAFQPTFGGGNIACSHDQNVCGEAFVTKLNPTGTAPLLYSTYLGGSGEDAAFGIAADSAGAAYVTGGTDSSDFPTTPGAFQTAFGGGSVGCVNAGFACGDGFVAKIDTIKTGAASLVYSTYLGGAGDDIAIGIAVDSTGSAYVAGTTNSTSFVLTPDATQNFFGGGTRPCTTNIFVCGDAFVAKLNPAGSGLSFSTYLGGSGDDGALGLALDSAGNAYVTGITASTDFPHNISRSEFQTTFGGGITDAFVAKIAGLNVPRVSLSPPAVAFGNQIINTASPTRSVILSNDGTGPLTISSITLGEINPGDFTKSNNCPVSPATLGARNLCTFTIKFSPTAVGNRSATISIVDSAAGSPRAIALSGTGTGGEVALSATSLQLPDTHVNQRCLPRTVTLTNSGAAPLSIAGIAISGQFTQTNSCPVGPATLAPGASCLVTVTFVPTTVGQQSGTLTVTSDALSSPNTVTLAGNAKLPCLVIPAVPALTVIRGADTATFSLKHQTEGGAAEDPLRMYCTSQAPASCAFDPGLVGPMGTSTLTLSNLKAVHAGLLMFDVHGDAGLDKHTTGLTVLISDFTFSSAPDTATVAAGQSTSFALVAAPQNGLQGTLSLTCSGAPAGATCAVSPSIVTLTGAAPVSVTVTVSTTARSLAPPGSSRRVLPLGGNPIGMLVLAMLGLMASLAAAKFGAQKSCSLGSLSSMRLRLATLGAGLTMAMVLAWGACGGGSFSGPPASTLNATPAGTYNLTVTGTYTGAPGTNAQLSHSALLKLTVR